MPTKSRLPYVWMLTSSAAFSGMMVLTPLAGRGCPWPVIAVVRSALPLVLVALWARLAGVRLVVLGPPTLWLRSLAGSCSLVGTFYALTRLPPGDVVTIANMFPIWVALLSGPMLGRFPAPAVWLAALSSVGGVALIQQPQLAAGNYDVLVVVAVSLFTALAMMGLHRLTALDPRAVVVHFSGTSLLFASAAALALPTSPPAEAFAGRHLALLFGVGLTATVGQLFLTRAFTTGEPARVAVVSLAQVVFVLLLQAALLGIPLEAGRLLGIPLIVVPTAWMMLRPPRAVPPPALDPVAADR